MRPCSNPFRPALPTPVAALLVLLAALVGLNTGVRGALARFGIELGNYHPLYLHAPGEVAAEAPARAQALIIDLPGRASGEVALEIESFALPVPLE